MSSGSSATHAREARSRFDHVLMVGNRHRLAPFVSMVKQLDREAGNGKRPAARYTLRTPTQLRGARDHQELLNIEKSNSFDLLYVPFGEPAHRPRPRRSPARHRPANNLLRNVFDLPAKDLEIRRPRCRGRGRSSC